MRPCFLDVSAAAVDDHARAHLKEHVRKTEERLRRLLSGRAKAWTDLYFPPPHGFPEVIGYRLEPGVVFRPPDDDVSGLTAVRIDLALEPPSRGELRVRLGGSSAQLQWEGDELRARVLGTEKAVRAQRHVSVTAARPRPTEPVRLVIAAGKRTMTFPAEEVAPTGDLELELERGEGHVLQVLGWGETSATYYAPSAADDGGERVARSSPYYVRAWEERARRLWHLLLGVALAREADEQLDHLARDPRRFRGDSLDLAHTVLASLAAAPYWRPSTGAWPHDGPWDRGNWANGFLIGAFGIALYLGGDTIDAERRTALRDVLVERGLRFFDLPGQKEFTETHFPPAAHWERRSTNHGVVMLSSALVGMKAAERVQRWSKDVRRHVAIVEHELHDLMERAFSDGCYLEGIRYAQFCLQEVLAYYLAEHHAGDEPWPTYQRRVAPFLGRVSRYVRLSAARGSDEPFARWGDCPSAPWKQSVLQFLDSIHSDDAEDLSDWIRVPSEAAADPDRVVAEELKTEPLLGAAAALPRGPRRERATPRLLCETFERSGFAALAYEGEDAADDWGLWLIASRMHRTHNRDHDLGSLILQVGGRIWVGEVPGRGMACHSTVGLMGEALTDDDDPYSCFGSAPAGKPVPRRYDGALTTQENGDVPRVITMHADRGLYEVEDGEPAIPRYRVDVVVLSLRPVAVMVVRRGRVSPGYRPFHQLVCPVETPDSESPVDRGRRYRFTGLGEIVMLHPGKDTRRSVVQSQETGATRLLESSDAPREALHSVQLLVGDRDRSWTVNTTAAEERFETVAVTSPGDGRSWTVTIPRELRPLDVRWPASTVVDEDVEALSSGRRVSVSVGHRVQLPCERPNQPLSFRSDNPRFEIDEDAGVRAVEEASGSEGRGVIEAIAPSGEVHATWPATIVPWRTDGPRLEILDELGAFTIVGHVRGQVLFLDERSLYATTDGFRTTSKLCDLPARQRYSSDVSPVLETSAGYFLRTDEAVLWSPDLRTWRVETPLFARGMWLNLCARRDPDSGAVQVFTGEYSVDPTYSHSVLRGEYRPGQPGRWRSVLQFHASRAAAAAGGLIPAARHVHLTTVDPFTGWLWVATGDSDRESAIYVSTDGGASFSLFAMGDQSYRTLAMWFTRTHVYWNMDTHTKSQRIFRARRDRFVRDGRITPLTPVLRRGARTRPGVRYLVVSDADGGLPREPGRMYRETEERTLRDAVAVSLNDPRYNVREEAANLGYGAQWFHLPVRDSSGTEWILMSASPESRVPGTKEAPFRDWNSRMFALRETSEGELVAFEAYTADPDPQVSSPKALRYNRIDPRCQDGAGFVYLMAHNSIHRGALKARFVATTRGE